MTAFANFDKWMLALREDCARNNKLLVLDNKGDYILESLWREGVEPTVEGMLAQAASIEPSEL
jgi:hypothetical protein